MLGSENDRCACIARRHHARDPHLLGRADDARHARGRRPRRRLAGLAGAATTPSAASSTPAVNAASSWCRRSLPMASRPECPIGQTFETLAGELCERIAAALPADGIVLTLHGAMVAEGFPDAEAEIARRVREPRRTGAADRRHPRSARQYRAGDGRSRSTSSRPTTPIPHIDAAERAREAVDLSPATIRGEIRPTMALAKPPLLPVPQAMATADGTVQNDLRSRAQPWSAPAKR